MSNQHDLRCPKCQSEHGVTVQILTWARLTHDGSDADIPQDHEWNDNSVATCAKCHFDGTVADFTRPSPALAEYVAYFRTTAGPANDIYQAGTPDQALRIRTGHLVGDRTYGPFFLRSANASSSPTIAAFCPPE